MNLLSEIRRFGLFMRVGGRYQKIGAKTAIKTCSHATKRQNRPEIGAIAAKQERKFFVGNLLVRIQIIIDMILVDRPCVIEA